jgi:hypothetical protein
MSMANSLLLTNTGAFQTVFNPEGLAEVERFGRVCSRLSQKAATWPGTADELYTTGLDVVLETLSGNGTLTAIGQQNQLAELATMLGPLTATGFGDPNANGTYSILRTHNAHSEYQNEHGYFLYWVLNDTAWGIGPDDNADNGNCLFEGIESDPNPTTTYIPTSFGTAPAGTVTGPYEAA